VVEEEKMLYSQKEEEVEEKTLYSQAENGIGDKRDEPMLHRSRRPSSPPAKLGSPQGSKEFNAYAGRGAIASYAREEAGLTGQTSTGELESHTGGHERTPQPYAGAHIKTGASRMEHDMVHLSVNSRTVPHTFKGEPYERKVLYSNHEGRAEQVQGPYRGEQKAGVEGRGEMDREDIKEEAVVAYTDEEFLEKVLFYYSMSQMMLLILLPLSFIKLNNTLPVPSAHTHT
jgi:hypothetical protein